MKILSGIDHHSVLQRNAEDVCDITISGVSSIVAPLKVHVTGSNNQLQIIVIPEEQITFESNDNHPYTFTTILSGIPIGGPYTIELRFNGSPVIFLDVYVGDVFILAGQSNMEGVGLMTAALPVNHRVKALFMNDSWETAKDPLHQLEEAVDPVHEAINGAPFGQRNPKTGVGPGMSFGQTYHAYTSLPVGLLACAHGGTSMTQWAPDTDFTSGKSLYSAMMRRFHKAGGYVKGLFWHQGCSDANPDDAPKYMEKMSHFIKQVREDTGIKDLPVVMAQISRVCAHDVIATSWNMIQTSQYKLGLELENVSVIPTIHYDMDDFIHLSGKSQNDLGKLAAKAMMHQLKLLDTYKSPIKLEKVEVIKYEDNWNCQIVLTYNHVIGTFTSKGRPEGFSLSMDSDALSGNYIYEIELKGHQIILHTTEPELDLKNMYLSYGFGYNPYCNITDEGGRSLPVIKNIIESQGQTLSEPSVKAWVHKEANRQTIPLTDKITELLNKHYKYVDFYYYNMDVRRFFVDTENDSISYLLPFSVETAMDINILLGSVGHVKVILDKTLVDEITLDKASVKPDQYKLPCAIDKGVHLIQVIYTPTDDEHKALMVRLENLTGDEKPVWM